MIVERRRRGPELAALTAILLGIASCTESPTGIPDRPASALLQPHNTIEAPQNCYLIDGQIYCVGSTMMPRDSTHAHP